MNKPLKLPFMMIVICCFLLSVGTVALADGEYAGTYAIVANPVSTDRLNVREAADHNAASIAKLYNGTFVRILSTDGEWAYIVVGHDEYGDGTITGYVDTDFLNTSITAKPSDIATPILTIRNTQGTGLNLRQEPNVASPVLGLFQNGDQITVLAVLRDWYFVQAGGRTGYMIASYLTPQLSFSSTRVTGTTVPTQASGWNNGPVGSHAVADWPANVTYNNAYGVVINPDAADRLNLRSKPSETASSLGKYYNGVRASHISDTSDPDWVKVQVGNLTGYFSTDYFDKEASGKSTTYASAMPLMEVSNPSGKLYLREKQSTTSSSLGLYPNGTSVILMGFTNDWAHVIVDGKTGFMLGKYLK